MVREAFSVDMAAKLIQALKESIDTLTERFNSRPNAAKEKQEILKSRSKKQKLSRSKKMHAPC